MGGNLDQHIWIVRLSPEERGYTKKICDEIYDTYNEDCEISFRPPKKGEEYVDITASSDVAMEDYSKFSPYFVLTPRL